MIQRKHEDIRVRRARQALEGESAMKEYLARADAVAKKTARLRELRLARDAAQNAAAESAAADQTKQKKK